MKLADIAELQPLLLQKAPDVAFTGIACDSRLVQPGEIFAALAGTRQHGAEYVAAALARGAAAVLSAQTLPDPTVPLIHVSDAAAALAVLSSALHAWPARALSVYGITGTNGKTTTTWLLRDFLRAAGDAVGALTTVQVEYGGCIHEARHTTPDACELQALLATMRTAGCDKVVMEVSSHALAQQRVGAMPFAAVAFTNLSQDHLDYHHDMEHYFRTKQQLFEQAARERAGTTVLCCLDDAYGVRMAAYLETLPLNVITYGLNEAAQLHATDVQLSPHGSTFKVVTPTGQRHTLTTGLSGRYNVANLLCAIGLALAAAVPWSVLVECVPRTRAQWGRLERVELDVPYAVFVDYAHTPEALRNVLSTLREITTGRLYVVFGCGGDRDRSKRPLMGAVCAAQADHLIVTSDNPRSEAELAIIEDILMGLPAGGACHVEPDRRQAIKHALKLAQADDVVLVAGKGHETYQEIKGCRLPFNDSAVVKELVKELHHVC